VGCETAGDTEADQAPIALTDGAVGDLFELVSGGAANHLHTGRSSYARFEVQPHKRDNEAPLRFHGGIGDPKRIVRVSHQTFDESSPGKIQLGCH
jgi:hypothetical protein